MSIHCCAALGKIVRCLQSDSSSALTVRDVFGMKELQCERKLSIIDDPKVCGTVADVHAESMSLDLTRRSAQSGRFDSITNPGFDLLGVCPS